MESQSEKFELAQRQATARIQALEARRATQRLDALVTGLEALQKAGYFLSRGGRVLDRVQFIEAAALACQAVAPAPADAES